VLFEFKLVPFFYSCSIENVRYLGKGLLKLEDPDRTYMYFGISAEFFRARIWFGNNQ
jgi:hypothetical protein